MCGEGGGTRLQSQGVPCSGGSTGKEQAEWEELGLLSRQKEVWEATDWMLRPGLGRKAQAGRRGGWSSRAG